MEAGREIFVGLSIRTVREPNPNSPYRPSPQEYMSPLAIQTINKTIKEIDNCEIQISYEQVAP